MVESKGEDHLFGDLVLRLLASGCPVRVRAEALVEIAAVVVDKIITSIDDLFGDEKGRTFGLRPIGFTRVEPVHALVIDGVNMGDLLFEGLNVDEGDKDNGAGDFRRKIERLTQAMYGRFGVDGEQGSLYVVC